jgi:hypothetical protein
VLGEFTDHPVLLASLGRLALKVGFGIMLHLLPQPRLNEAPEPRAHTTFTVRPWSVVHPSWSPHAGS